ncbi:hypothetical protein GC174_01975 [bacterium]|nr:hypothetical protein [bacterium]
MKSSKLAAAGTMVLLSCQLSAFAYPISMSEAAIEGKLATANIGMLKIPRGSVKLKGDSISVGAVPDWLFDRHVVLKGKVISTRMEGSKIQGLAYFLEGDWLNNLDNIRRKDNIELDNGTVLVGKVRAVEEGEVVFQLSTGPVKKIKKTTIAKLVSPRSYIFEIPANNVKIDAGTGSLSGDAENIAFLTTMNAKSGKGFNWLAKKTPVEPKSLLAGTEGGISKAQLSTLIFLDIANTVAPIVIAPIVASPLGTKSADRQLNEFNQFENILSTGGTVVIP